MAKDTHVRFDTLKTAMMECNKYARARKKLSEHMPSTNTTLVLADNTRSDSF